MAECEGKRAFPTGAMARYALQGIRVRGGKLPDGRKPVREYACSRCGRFHLTSQWEKP